MNGQKLFRRLPLKEWLSEESARLGIVPHAVRMRMERGKYPEVTVIRKNARVIDVLVPAERNLK